MAVDPVSGRTATLLVTMALSGCGHPPTEPIAADGWGPTGIHPTAVPEPPRPPAPRARLIPEDERERWRHADAIAKLGRGRFFVTEYPAEQAALARLDVANPEVAERFELVVDGVEIANGYHELGDAAELQRRFQNDCEQRKRLGLVCPEVDERFLAAMASGLPDCAGVALGVDRLLMLQLGASSLAEVMPFPVTVA